MNWQWVVLILGLVLNLTIILIAMSEGAQDGLRGYSYWRSVDDRKAATKVPTEIPEDETTRRL